MRVAQRFGRQRRDHLAEPHIAFGERLRLTLRAEKDRSDDRRSPSDRHDDDRPHVPEVERGARVLEHRIVRRVGNEDRVARLERPFELGIPVQIDDQIPDRWIFIAGDEPNVGVAASEIDRAAIEPERFAQLAGDRLQNIYEVQRGRDVLENIDNRDQLVTLALQLRDPLLQPGGLRVRWGIAFDR